jgi:hypothetical protein
MSSLKLHSCYRFAIRQVWTAAWRWYRQIPGYLICLLASASYPRRQDRFASAAAFEFVVCGHGITDSFEFVSAFMCRPVSVGNSLDRSWWCGVTEDGCLLEVVRMHAAQAPFRRPFRRTPPRGALVGTAEHGKNSPEVVRVHRLPFSPFRASAPRGRLTVGYVGVLMRCSA